MGNLVKIRLLGGLALAAMVCALLAGCTSVPSHNDAWLSFKYKAGGAGCGAYNYPAAQATADLFNLPGQGPTVASSACPGLSDLNEAQNYYKDIGAPPTLAKWKAAYGFPATGNPPARAIYGNYRDLRIGRDMNCVQTGRQVACYVTNDGPSPQDCNDNTGTYLSVTCPWPSLEAAVDDIATLPNPPPPPAQITSFVLSFSTDPYGNQECGVGFQANNSFTPGQTIVISGLTVGTYINTLQGVPFNLTNTGFELSIYCGQIPSIPSAASSGGLYNTPPTADSGTATFLDTNAFATVAMVYNGNPNTSTTSPSNNITFYVYDQFGNLLPFAALDAEGAKSVPRMCMACHGGTYTPHSATSPATVTGTSFLPFDVPSFYYSTQFKSLDMDPQQEAFRMLNLMVKTTNGGSQPQTPNQQAITDFINGMYCPDPNNGGVLANCTTPVENTGSVAGDTYVPVGWAGSSANRKVYSEVVKPYCRMCHMAQPVTLTTPDQFTAFAAPLVCTQNDMPHAEVPFGGDTATLTETVYPPIPDTFSINPFISNKDSSVFWLDSIAQNDVQTATNTKNCQ